MRQASDFKSGNAAWTWSSMKRRLLAGGRVFVLPLLPFFGGKSRLNHGPKGTSTGFVDM